MEKQKDPQEQTDKIISADLSSSLPGSRKRKVDESSDDIVATVDAASNKRAATSSDDGGTVTTSARTDKDQNESLMASSTATESKSGATGATSKDDEKDESSNSTAANSNDVKDRATSGGTQQNAESDSTNPARLSSNDGSAKADTNSSDPATSTTAEVKDADVTKAAGDAQIKDGVTTTTTTATTTTAMGDASMETDSSANVEKAGTEPSLTVTNLDTDAKASAASIPIPHPSPRHASGSSSSHNSRNDKTSYDKLKWVTVTNDGSPDSMVKLIGLKSLFAKQLPKMPRAYIARLVLDRRHTSLAILSDNPAVTGTDEEIIGGICYRAFADMRFAEIAFCAVNATHQVKGYGTKLMNLLKQTAARTGIEFFITYADNYAIGYFKKQGFTKQITMPKGRYYGLIKDYDGGTPMECYVHPSIDYCNVPALVQAQRDFLLQRVARLTHHSLTIYPPLPTLMNSSSNAASSAASASILASVTSDGGGVGVGGGPAVVSRGHWAAAQALSVPGVIDAGWTLVDLIQASVAKGGGSGGNGNGDDGNLLSGGMRQKSGALKQELLGLVRKMEEQQFAWPFREPVDTNEVPDYLDVITTPIDLKTMAARIRHDNYYKSKQMLYADVLLMVNNCKLYNEDGSTYIQCAVSLEKYARTLFHDAVSASAVAGSGGSAATSSSGSGAPYASSGTAS